MKSALFDLEAPSPATRKDLVAKTLRDAILSGKLPPGSALIEAKLAEQLQVSRSPLREAIRQLAEEGLVRTVSYKGATVAEIDDTLVEELYSLRAALEEFALSRILPLRDQRLIDPLEEIVRRMFVAADGDDKDTLIELNIEFHRKLCELTRHELLIKHWETISNHVRRCVSVTPIYRQDLEHIPRNHAALMKVIRTGTPQEATAAMRDHVTKAGEALRGWIAENSKAI